MAGKFPKADPAILLNCSQHQPNHVSGMDKKQISGLFILESSSDALAP